MSQEKSAQINTIEFNPILPDSGFLFYEECSAENEIQRPILLPLKTSTQIRFEELQYEAARAQKEKNKTSKQS